MADISLKREHQLGLKGAKAAADQMAERLNERFDLSGTWQGHVMNFSRPGVSGMLSITETTMSLEVTLGFLLKAMKGPIEKSVHEQLDKVLTDAKPAAPKTKPAAKSPDKPTAAKKPAAKKK